MTRAGHAHAPLEIDAFYRPAAARRDVRNGFRPDRVDDEVLTGASPPLTRRPASGSASRGTSSSCATGPSGSASTGSARAQQDVFAAALPRARALPFSRLKVEAILESPLNIVVTCDPTGAAGMSWGRHAQPQVAEYSAVAHVLEAETGFRYASPLRALAGEPRPEYDPVTTTVAQRRAAKAAQLRAL